MDNIKKQTLAVLVDNEAGVLSQVSRLFSRKGYNIESLAVGATHNPAVSRITIQVLADDDHCTLVVNQLRKLLPVHSVQVLDRDDAISRELVIIKIAVPDGQTRNEVIQIANVFRAQVIDVSVGAVTIAMIGDEQKTQGLQNILSEFKIAELVRTGSISIERGPKTIYDQTKEKGEFNYGKNVL